MIERWTVDAIASEVQERFEAAEPSPKLLRRFYRLGKSDGRKSLPTEAARDLLANAVELACSRIGERLQAELTQAARNLALAADRLAQLQRQGRPPSPAGETDEVQAPASADAVGEVAGPDLRHALDRLNRSRAEARARQEAADWRSRTQAHEAEVQTLLGTVSQERQTLDDLAPRYAQTIESCHEAGEMVWSRYVAGYTRGRAGGGPDDTAANGPLAPVTFRTPTSLTRALGLARTHSGNGA